MRPLHLVAAACVARAQNAVLLCGSAHTGTHQVKLALETLGLSNIVVDHPQFARYEAHLAAHPSSKVLLTTRDAGRWRTSIQQSRPEAALEKAQARREAYEKGVRAAASHLLELDLEAGATYGALCAFLGVSEGCPAATDTLPRNLAMQKKTPAPQNHESVSSLLATARMRTNVVKCRAALLVYPGFEDIHREAIDRADAEWPLGWELREFLPEVFVVDGTLHHPCRAPFDPLQDLPLAATTLSKSAQARFSRSWAPWTSDRTRQAAGTTNSRGVDASGKSWAGSKGARHGWCSTPSTMKTSGRNSRSSQPRGHSASARSIASL